LVEATVTLASIVVACCCGWIARGFFERWIDKR